MMKLTAILTLWFVTCLSSVQGLAFVTFVMQPIVNPVAAMKSASQRLAMIVTPVKATNTARFHNKAASSKMDVLAFGLDYYTQEYRSEMLELVYARSMDRMDSLTQ